MRRVMVWGPKGSRERLLGASERHGAVGTLVSTAHSDEREVDLAVTHLPNREVDSFVDELTRDLDEVHVSMLPHGVLALHPPPGRAPDEVVDVGSRSPLEIVLSSMQSIGSWWSFLTYAATSGAIVFAAFYTNTVFLLVGAMLISPMAEPTMNAAISTARGAGRQLLRSVGRYLAALASGAAAAAALTIVYGLDEPTSLMAEVASPSLAAILLPLGAGIAGAVNLVSSQRSSLVSGAGPGLLIAASLAPPMGLVGMALVLSEPGVLAASLFVLALQLAGINIAAAIVFRLAGVRSSGMRYARGRPAVQRAAGVVSLLAVCALLVVQFAASPNLRRETLERDAETAARDALTAMAGVRPVSIEARYAREDVADRRTLLVTGYASRTAQTQQDTAALEAAVSKAVTTAIRRELPDTAALVDIAVAAP